MTTAARKRTPADGGFPPLLREALDEVYPGNAGPCGMCGDTILGGRHRVLDAIAERLQCGESPEEIEDDYGVTADKLWIVVMASYEHDLAEKRLRRVARVT